MESVTFEVVHVTRYTYAEPVTVSHHVARLGPLALPHQARLAHALRITPAPAVQTTHTDYFGNATTIFTMQGVHTVLEVVGRSTVCVTRPVLPAPDDTVPWEEATVRSALPLDAVEASFDSLAPRMSAELKAYAVPSFPAGRALLAGVVDLTHRIHREFTFDPRATTVATPLTDVFRLRRGVCQDFARVEIACLRALGLPARYVSGYLETVPPPGKPRLVGADASHAWVAVYCPGHGWIDADPTNDVLPTTRHVTLARGLDYGDVSPIRGVILGGGHHTLRVQVDVVRVAADSGVTWPAAADA